MSQLNKCKNEQNIPKEEKKNGGGRRQGLCREKSIRVLLIVTDSNTEVRKYNSTNARSSPHARAWPSSQDPKFRARPFNLGTVV